MNVLMPPPRLGRAQPWHYPLAALLIGGIAFYRSCLNGYFLADDFGYIQLYSKISLPRFRALFVNDWSQGIWGWNIGELRPLTGLTYWLDYRLWGVNAFGYHLTNLVLHTFVIAGFYVLVLEIARTLGGTDSSDTAIRWSAGLAALLFLLHPSHIEAIAWIAGRTDLLGAATYLWSMYFLIRFWGSGSRNFAVAGIAFYAAGLFMKESVVTMPAGFLLYVILAGGLKERWKELLTVGAPLGVLAVVWVVFRRIAFGAGSGVKLEETQILGGRILYYAGQIFLLSPAAATVAFAILAIGCMIAGWLAWENTGRLVLFWGIGWPLLHLLPLIAVHYESPRHVLLIAAGPLALLSSAATMAWRRSRLVAVLALAFCLVLGTASWARAVDQLALWELSSNYSRQLSTLLAESNYPPDSIVLFNSSPELPIWFRQWTLPFAVEKPFIDFKARFVAKPDWYCCPAWGPNKAALLAEIAAGASQRVYQIDFDPDTGRFVSH